MNAEYLAGGVEYMMADAIRLLLFPAIMAFVYVVPAAPRMAMLRQPDSFCVLVVASRA